MTTEITAKLKLQEWKENIKFLKAKTYVEKIKEVKPCVVKNNQKEQS